MNERVERARALLDLQRAEQAVPLLAAHLAEHPEDGDALAVLAHARLLLKDPRGALTAANAAVAADPEEEWPHRIASVALIATGQREEALRAAGRAVALRPDAWQTRTRMASALSANARPQEAWQEAMAAVALAPDVADTHRAAGDVALAAGWHDVAEQAFHRALAIEPDNAGLVNDLGRLDFSRGQLGPALGSFTGAARLAPADPTGAQNLEVVGWRLVRRLSWVVTASSIPALALSGEENADGSRWPLLLVCLCVLLAVVARVARLVRGLPPLARTALRQRVVLSPAGRVCSALVLLALGAWLSWPWLPATSRAAIGSLLLADGLVIWLITLRGPRRDAADQQGPPGPALSWRRRPRG